MTLLLPMLRTGGKLSQRLTSVSPKSYAAKPQAPFAANIEASLLQVTLD